MSRLRLLLLAAILASRPAFAVDPLDLDKLYPQVRPAVVILFCYDSEDNLFGMGTGFFVSADGQMITCRHVIEGAARIDAKTDQGKLIPVKGIIEMNEQADIALLSLAITDATFIPLTQSAPVPLGSNLFVLGNPLGKEGVASEGKLTAKGDWQANHNMVVSAAVAPGASGAPTINARGEAIGIVKAMEISTRPVAFVVPSEAARDMLSRHPSGSTLEITALETIDWGNTYKVHLDPDYLLAAQCLMTSNFKKAQEALLKVLEKYPDSGDVVYRLGACYASLHDYDNAEKYFKKATELDPQSPWAWTRLGQIYVSEKKLDEAIVQFHQALKLEKDLLEGWASLGVAYANKGQIPEATDAFEKASDLNPDDPSVLRALGECYLALNEPVKAIPVLEHTTDLIPRDPYALELLGRAYEKSGRSDRKWETDRRIRELSPKK